MSESIFTLYSDEKFERILYYLKERGFVTFDDLASFDFDELLFVPGVTESLVLEAKQLFSSYSKDSLSVPEITNTSEAVSEDLHVPYNNSNIYETNMYSNEDECLPKQANKLKDALIIDVFLNVPRSAPFIKKCIADGKLFMSQLTDTDFDNAINIKGIGIASAENLRRVFVEFMNSASNFVCYSDSNELSKLYYLENIASENRAIPITLLCNIRLPKNGIDLFIKNNFLTVGDLCDRGLTLQEYFFARTINSYFSVPVTKRFVDTIEALKKNEKFCILKRCEGATLEQIGNVLQITRERARQILYKTCRKLVDIAELIASVLLASDKSIFSFTDLTNLFRSEELAAYCKLVLQQSEYVRYFKFSDSFVKTEICGHNVDERLEEFVSDIIGKGINFYDNLELIESELINYNLGFFDVVDIMNYLVHNGYRFYGDFVTKGHQSYALICHDAVRKFFSFDIKLDSDENNEDMRKLRHIIAKHYHGAYLPPNNRALTAGITRDPSKLILCGRGRYCPIEKVIYSISLFEELHRFIISSPQTSFYYSELFSHFQGRFLAETNIDNPNFLHGMLKYLYPNEFAYERDLLIKIGELREDIDDRLSHLLLNKGRAMTKAEIKQSIPGINDFVITFSATRLPAVIQWDYNEYNHINNIKITQNERTVLYETIKTQLELYNGYSNDALLFHAVKDVCGDLLSRNNITKPQNLFYVVSCFFEESFRFRRPHILSKDFPIKEITATNIARALLHCETYLNYEEYCRLAAKLGWASGTVSSIFCNLEKDFIRISENDYVHKDYFSVSKELIESLAALLQELVCKSGYFAISSIFDYELFPKCSYKWNGFLLESLITEYNTGFRIIYPQIQDRRCQKGIIVPNDSPYNTFEELVIGILKSDNISNLSEIQLLKYLKLRGLIVTNTIPQELYKNPKIQFKNEVFTIK